MSGTGQLCYARRTRVLLLRAKVSLYVASGSAVSLFIHRYLGSLRGRCVVQTYGHETGGGSRLLFPTFFSILSSKGVVTWFSNYLLCLLRYFSKGEGVVFLVRSRKGDYLKSSYPLYRIEEDYFLFERDSTSFSSSLLSRRWPWDSAHPSETHGEIASSVCSESPPAKAPLTVLLALVPMNLVDLLVCVTIISPSELRLMTVVASFASSFTEHYVDSFDLVSSNPVPDVKRVTP